MKNSDFAHLHIHNEFSQLDGLGTAEDYAICAEELGFEYMALTNHGNIDGIIKWQKTCKEHNIKPIFGCEFYFVPDIEIREKGEKKHHMTILAKNLKGLESIMRLLTVANDKGYYYKPRIDWETLGCELDNIIILSACTSTFLHLPKNDVESLFEAMGEDIYIELMPHQFELQHGTNKLALEYANEYGVKVVATNDCHYPKESGAATQEVLLAMQRKAKWTDKNRWKFEINGLYLKSADEMILAFKEQGQIDRGTVYRAMKNTIEVAEKCIFNIEQKKVYLPKVPAYEKRDESKFLKSIINRGLKERCIDTGAINELQIDQYRERIDEEFKLICNLKFQRYFLIVWELISWCKKNDIMVGPGRGSVGGSLVAYCMRIIDVDPIKHGLIFARFISPTRIDLPDIDIDFEDIKRYKIREHLEELYGEDHVTSLSTFMRMKGRSAIRDVSRAFSVPLSEVNVASKSIVTKLDGDSRSDFTIEDSFKQFEDGINFKKKYPEVTQFAIDLEGQIKNSGKHAAAICISSDDLKKGIRTNLAKRKDELVSNWDKKDAEYMGIMKLDVLGLKTLTILNYTKKLVKENYDIDIDYNKIKLDDKKTLSQINLGKTTGVFQLGTTGLKKFCQELGVEEFNDIVHATALWRPGTLGSGLTSEFVERKHGRASLSYIHPILQEKTKETQGIILYQEQLMWLMYELAGLEWKVCDEVRKVIGKSEGGEKFASFKKQFVDGCLKMQTLEKNEATELWESLSSFGNYSFNKAHAVAYSLITYWDMWCKTHYPKEFMAASLSYSDGDSKQDLIEEARRLNVEIALPKVKYSATDIWRTDKEKNVIYCPFSELKGVGEKTAEQIQHLNKEGFYSGKGRSPNKNVLSILHEIKAFDEDDINEIDENELSKYFDFSISKDPMRQYRTLYERLKNKLTSISSDSKGLDLLFGNMLGLQFKYKKNALNGVYGTFKDETDSAMVIFDKELYEREKEKIEHCAESWALLECKKNHNSKNLILDCQDIWNEDDINQCNLEGLELDLIGDKKYRSRNCLRCQDCELSEECTKPIPNTLGKTNIMIISEYPGLEEDRNNEILKGKSGNKLWDSLRIDDLHKDDFFVSSVTKCYPKETKKPKKKHISTCSQYLEEELKRINPPLVLALGNTCLKFFKDKDSGIMELSGTTEWNGKYGCWIHWCIHPNSTMFDDSNDGLFEQSISKFVDKISYITNIYKD